MRPYSIYSGNASGNVLMCQVYKWKYISKHEECVLFKMKLRYQSCRVRGKANIWEKWGDEIYSLRFA